MLCQLRLIHALHIVILIYFLEYKKRFKSRGEFFELKRGGRHEQRSRSDGGRGSHTRLRVKEVISCNVEGGLTGWRFTK